jgi:hypothetical protein
MIMYASGWQLAARGPRVDPANITCGKSQDLEITQSETGKKTTDEY